KALITPVYKGEAPGQLTIGMTDHRTFILSADKEPWFEGIFHGAYGIPHSLQRPGPKTGQPFTTYLSDMLADGLRANGTDVSVVALRPGADMAEAISQVSGDTGTAGLIFRIVHSRYVIGWGKAEYRHHFDITVTNAAGAVVLEKTFERFDTKLPLSDTYTIMDMYAAIYKNTLDEVLADPEVMNALGGLAVPPTG
ncbi:MAG: hypothetical protein AAFN51_00195, partial [Pseudomonadota bacterium]